MEGTRQWCINRILEYFCDQRSNIYFGRWNILYVISRQLIANVFGVCQSGYVEYLKV